jgi:hypothetical protein
MTRHIVSIFAATTMLAGTSNAQVTPKPVVIPAQLTANNGALAGCPGGNGIHISTTLGTLTDSASGSDTVIPLGQSVDTTLVFDISRKTWTRNDIAAQISVGIADETRGTYAVCAGVSALLPSATLTISGAHGRVHFAASLADFTNSLRRSPTR